MQAIWGTPGDGWGCSAGSGEACPQRSLERAAPHPPSGEHKEAERPAMGRVPGGPRLVSLLPLSGCVGGHNRPLS